MALDRREVYEILNEPNPNKISHQIVTVVIVASIAVVLGIGIFNTVDAYKPKLANLLWLEYLAVGVFVVEYVFRIWSAVEDERFKSKRFPRLAYALTPSAVIDFLAIAPVFIGFGALSELRILRLFAVFKFTRHSRLLSVFVDAMRATASSFLAGVGMLFLMLVIAATGAYYFEASVQPDNFGSIPASMWWAIATLTTVGYGDVYPITVGGRIFGAAAMIVGIGIAALPAGLFASATLDVLSQRREDNKAILSELLRDKVEPSEDELLALAHETKIPIRQVREAAKAHANTAMNAAHCPNCGCALSSD